MQATLCLDTPLQLIEALEPDVLVKGGDYDPNETDASSLRYMVGSQETRNRGGSVHSIPIVEGYSTTKAIQKLKGKAKQVQKQQIIQLIPTI
jgi:bifunctional ADP-heptose synthase (sugar kinase/adenylyltransferase)